MKKKTKKTIDQPVVFSVILLVVIVLITGILAKGKLPWSQTASDENNNETNEEVRTGQQVASIKIKAADDSTEHADSNMEQIVSNAVPAGERVKYKIDKFQFLTTQPLKFNIYDEKGKELTPDFLQTQHEKKLHFILVSANLKEFQHLHPVYQGGVWNVPAYMPTPGTYYAYIDITPIQGNAVVVRSNLTVREPTSGQVQYPGLTPNLVALSNSYKAELKLNTTPSRETTFSYRITKGDKAAILQPYLESFGHVVVLRHGSPNTYLHLHPLMTSDPSTGLVELTGSLASGTYTAFAEMKMDGKVINFPITFTI